MRALTLFLISASAWRIHRVDPVTAKTVLRLWHELYTERQTAHDFVDLLAPSSCGVFVAASRHDEIRAIAKCEHVGDDLHVQRVAHMIDQPNAVACLLEALGSDGAHFDHDLLRRHQPRWFLEALLVSAEVTHVDEPTRADQSTGGGE